MSYQIDLSVKSTGDITILNIAGDITALTGHTVEEACKSEDMVDSNHILMNFSQDCYFNSGGIAFLIDITMNARKKGKTVSISGLSDHFRKIFKMVGLTRWVAIYNTSEDLVNLH